MEVSCKVPCRKCAKCLLYRQMKWRERAIIECGKARRTWNMVLTIDPQVLANIHMCAVDYSVKAIENEAYKRVQRYFKRLRKQLWKTTRGKAEFKYLACYELGERSGRPHYHLLLHETGTRPILKELLEAQWRSNVWARLVGGDERVEKVEYVTKRVTSYTTKSFAIRPRASAEYGKPSSPQIS